MKPDDENATASGRRKAVDCGSLLPLSAGSPAAAGGWRRGIRISRSRTAADAIRPAAQTRRTQQAAPAAKRQQAAAVQGLAALAGVCLPLTLMLEL